MGSLLQTVTRTQADASLRSFPSRKTSSWALRHTAAVEALAMPPWAKGSGPLRGLQGMVMGRALLVVVLLTVLGAAWGEQHRRERSGITDKLMKVLAARKINEGHSDLGPSHPRQPTARGSRGGRLRQLGLNVGGLPWGKEDVASNDDRKVTEAGPEGGIPGVFFPPFSATGSKAPLKHTVSTSNKPQTVQSQPSSCVVDSFEFQCQANRVTCVDACRRLRRRRLCRQRSRQRSERPRQRSTADTSGRT